jgi:hypothetical protein
MNMMCCPFLSILRTRKISDGPLVFGEDLGSFAIFDIVGSHDGSGAPPTPLGTN